VRSGSQDGSRNLPEESGRHLADQFPSSIDVSIFHRFIHIDDQQDVIINMSDIDNGYRWLYSIDLSIYMIYPYSFHSWSQDVSVFHIYPWSAMEYG
jgi:hypothetical protein